MHQRRQQQPRQQPRQPKGRWVFQYDDDPQPQPRTHSRRHPQYEEDAYYQPSYHQHSSRPSSTHQVPHYVQSQRNGYYEQPQYGYYEQPQQRYYEQPQQRYYEQPQQYYYEQPQQYYEQPSRQYESNYSSDDQDYYVEVPQVRRKQVEVPQQKVVYVLPDGTLYDPSQQTTKPKSRKSQQKQAKREAKLKWLSQFLGSSDEDSSSDEEQAPFLEQLLGLVQPQRQSQPKRQLQSSQRQQAKPQPQENHFDIQNLFDMFVGGQQAEQPKQQPKPKPQPKPQQQPQTHFDAQHFFNHFFGGQPTEQPKQQAKPQPKPKPQTQPNAEENDKSKLVTGPAFVNEFLAKMNAEKDKKSANFTKIVEQVQQLQSKYAQALQDAAVRAKSQSLTADDRHTVQCLIAGFDKCLTDLDMLDLGDHADLKSQRKQFVRKILEYAEAAESVLHVAEPSKEVTVPSSEDYHVLEYLGEDSGTESVDSDEDESEEDSAVEADDEDEVHESDVEAEEDLDSVEDVPVEDLEAPSTPVYTPIVETTPVVETTPITEVTPTTVDTFATDEALAIELSNQWSAAPVIEATPAVDETSRPKQEATLIELTEQQ